jgi:ferric-dicitrate binding protein FerR (iron transport regulator)
MSSETDNKALLQQLRIDRTESTPTNAPTRRPLLIGGLIALAALAALLWWLLGAAKPLPVHVAAAPPAPRSWMRPAT